MSESTVERRDPRSLGRGAEQFEKHVHADEIESINVRREKNDRGRVDVVDKEVVSTNGLALSGGGVRSAAFCLGALQALNQHDVIKSFDYLSTVSGGGYIGSAMTATMTVAKGQFVFGDQPSDPLTPVEADISDTAQVGHIRNYSNYLIPYGLRDAMTGAAIIVRGLVANLGLVLPVILIGAGITVLNNPDIDSLGEPVLNILSGRNFAFTILVSLGGLVAFALWALIRSFLKVNDLAEFRTPLPAIFGSFLVGLAIVVFFEFQPVVLASMFKAAIAESDPSTGLMSDVVMSWKEWLVALIAPITAIVTFFNKYFADVIKTGNSGTGWTSALSGLVARAAVWVAGAALPLLIWLAYLYLCFWAIPFNPTDAKQGVVAKAAEVSPGETANLTFELGPVSVSAECKLIGDSSNLCPAEQTPAAGQEPITGSTDSTPGEGQGAAANAPADQAEKEKTSRSWHRPAWIAIGVGAFDRISAQICRALGVPPTQRKDGEIENASKPVAYFYLCTGAFIFLLALLLKPNANSLSRLYQDRLSKAFLFDPTRRRSDGGITKGRDFASLDIQLSKLDNKYVPYHLINAAVNVQGSDFSNRRGRNADFFLFSPRYVGSPATGYAKTTAYEPDPPDLDLGKALSISGAAFSSEMGSKSIRALAPTFALLNVRLGYWLANPFHVLRNRNKRGGPRFAPYYIFKEMIGWLDETTPVVYVTDGGHIENLGIYELLRRRCKLILVVDAEADPTMDFPSFIDLQRYARLDFGVRIRIPWKEISESTLAWMGAYSPTNEKPPKEIRRGPHVAVGTIEYGGTQKGYLVYVKASLTGDENDYVRDYSRRNPKFPHESTGDQFFGEEQFECYRALGFHVINGFLGGSAGVLVDPSVLPKTPSSTAAKSAGGVGAPTSTTAAASSTASSSGQAGSGSEKPETAASSAEETEAADAASQNEQAPLVDPAHIVSSTDGCLDEIRKLLGLIPEEPSPTPQQSKA